MNDNTYLVVASFCKDEIKIVVQRGKIDSMKGTLPTTAIHSRLRWILKVLVKFEIGLLF